jgi:pyruvate formate lyase activating enzyme
LLNDTDSLVEAMHYESLADGQVICHLCAHGCRVRDGGRGICGVRENRGGTLYSLIAGRMSSMNADPIEKKPLYHFHPATMALSFGTVGCNFSCAHCQNYSISQADPGSFGLRRLDPADVPRLTRNMGCQGVSWTYNEPSIWYETTLAGSKAAMAEGLYTCYVTNGYIEEAPLREIAPVLGAMNVDVKAFRDAFYRDVCKARLQPVLDTCQLARELGIFIELTYLIIPGLNDADDEFAEFAAWVRDSLDPSVPVHFSRFHPDFQMTDRGRTPRETMRRAVAASRSAGLEHVYVGNIHQPEDESTRCVDCRTVLVDRAGFHARVRYGDDGRCPKCGRPVPFVL